MPRSVLIIVVATCAIALATFVGLAVFMGPADHLGAVPWADPERSAPSSPLLVPQDQEGGAPPGQTGGSAGHGSAAPSGGAAAGSGGANGGGAPSPGGITPTAPPGTH